MNRLRKHLVIGPNLTRRLILFILKILSRTTMMSPARKGRNSDGTIPGHRPHILRERLPDGFAVQKRQLCGTRRQEPELIVTWRPSVASPERTTRSCLGASVKKTDARIRLLRAAAPQSVLAKHRQNLLFVSRPVGTNDVADVFCQQRRRNCLDCSQSK